MFSLASLLILIPLPMYSAPPVSIILRLTIELIDTTEQTILHNPHHMPHKSAAVHAIIWILLYAFRDQI